MTRPTAHCVLTFGVIAGLFVTFTAARVEAQRFGRLPQPRAGACFYRDASFRGDYFCVRSGDAIDALPNDLNDQISSIRMLGGGVEVTVFQNRGFKGKSKRFDEDVRNLRDEGWNDKLSSVRVQRVSRGDRPGRDRDGDRDRDRDRDGDRGFGTGNGSAERIVRRAYQDILNREPDEAGLRLYRSRIIDDHWTEEQVRETLRRSPEYRAQTTMTRARATEIVRRAYLSVLNRERMRPARATSIMSCGTSGPRKTLPESCARVPNFAPRAEDAEVPAPAAGGPLSSGLRGVAASRAANASRSSPTSERTSRARSS